jgi:6-phosphogluconolactonase (cycloisomerase 2 family)
MTLRCLCNLLAPVCFVASVGAQNNFVYTNNDKTGPNTVSGFAVGKDGVLMEVPGSPFPTGGRGGPDNQGRAFASNRIRVVGNFLYASNADRSSNNVSGFSIDPDTGNLTLVPGSPFPTGGDGNFGISLAATPDGRFLYAGNNGSSDITVFAIGSEGELTRVGDLVPSGEDIEGMAVSPDGKWLAVVLTSEGSHGSVAMYRIDWETGELAPVKGSPFAPREPGGLYGIAAGVDINCASDTLFLAEGTWDTTIVDALRIDPDTGELAPIKGSPFAPSVGLNSIVPLLNPDDSVLFVSNTFGNSVTVFTVASDGSLTLVPGSPFDAGRGGGPAGMATDREGRFLYTTMRTLGVSVFTVASDGSLTLVPGSPFLIHKGMTQHLWSMAAYPAKSCLYRAK